MKKYFIKEAKEKIEQHIKQNNFNKIITCLYTFIILICILFNFTYIYLADEIYLLSKSICILFNIVLMVDFCIDLLNITRQKHDINAPVIEEYEYYNDLVKYYNNKKTAKQEFEKYKLNRYINIDKSMYDKNMYVSDRLYSMIFNIGFIVISSVILIIFTK